MLFNVRRFLTNLLHKPLKKSKHDLCIPRNIENTVSFCLLLQNFYYFYSKIVDTGAGYAAGASKVIGKLGKKRVTSLCIMDDLRSVVHSISPSPFFGITYCFAFIYFPKFSYIICQRIIWIWCT